MSDQDVLERPDVETKDTDTDRPKVFHYVNKNAMVESVVAGSHVVALCGEVFPVRLTAKPGSPVCQDCKDVFDKLPT